MVHNYEVTGMTCDSCAEKITKALSDLPEITNVRVDRATSSVLVTMNQHVGVEILNKALKPLHKYHLRVLETTNHATPALPKKSLSTYWPLILVVLYIAFATYYLSYLHADFSWQVMMPNVMGLFFLSFGFFKLLDVRGFASSYLSYDIPTKIWPIWGYIYPFVELGLGLSFLFRWFPIYTNAVTLIVMSISIIGVIQSVLQKRAIRCACLGTGFNLPMSTVTIIEDASMIIMAAVMLWAQLG